MDIANAIEEANGSITPKQKKKIQEIEKNRKEALKDTKELFAYAYKGKPIHRFCVIGDSAETC